MILILYNIYTHSLYYSFEIFLCDFAHYFILLTGIHYQNVRNLDLGFSICSFKDILRKIHNNPKIQQL